MAVSREVATSGSTILGQGVEVEAGVHRAASLVPDVRVATTSLEKLPVGHCWIAADHAHARNMLFAVGGNVTAAIQGSRGKSSSRP